MTPAARLRLAHILVWVTPALWSSNYLIARAGQGVIHPHLLALGRWGLALALMLPFAAKGLATGFAQWRHEWPMLLGLGALGMWICGAFVYIGGHSTSAANIALIYAAAPVAITIIGTRMLGERLAPLQWGGVALALAGVLLVIARGRPQDLLAVRLSAGDLWIAVATLSWIAYSLLQQRWRTTLSTLERLTVVTAGGVLVLLPFTLLEALLLPPLPFSAKALGLVVAAALLPGVFSYQAHLYMTRELGAARTSLALYLAPVFGALNAWWLLGEVPQWYHLAGAALILPAIAVATRGAPAPGAGSSASPAASR